MTPEGKVKQKIDEILKAADFCYYHKPVLTPYGSATVDYVGCSKGRFFAIEAKSPRVSEPTARQAHILEEMSKAGATAFFINGTQAQLDSLRDWLDS